MVYLNLKYGKEMQKPRIPLFETKQKGVTFHILLTYIVVKYHLSLTFKPTYGANSTKKCHICSPHPERVPHGVLARRDTKATRQSS